MKMVISITNSCSLLKTELRCMNISNFYFYFVQMYMHRMITYDYNGLIVWLNNRLMIDWLTDWLIDWMNDWSLIDWLIDWYNWLIDWLIDWLIEWMIDHLLIVAWWMDRMDRLVDRWIDWLMDYLIIIDKNSKYFFFSISLTLFNNRIIVLTKEIEYAEKGEDSY